jgi:hypothetical protein
VAAKRQQEIVEALDITKNQAPGALPAPEESVEQGEQQHSQSIATPHRRSGLNVAA